MTIPGLSVPLDLVIALAPLALLGLLALLGK